PPTDALPSELQLRCGELVASDAHYAEMAARGLAYGVHFQGVAELSRGHGEALGRLHRADSGPGSIAARIALLDACFQVLVATAPRGRTYVPVAIQRIQIYDRLAQDAEMWAHAVQRENTDESDAVVEGDVFL